MLLRIILISIAKLLRAVLRIAGGHGSALPGLVIERLHRGFLADMLKTLPKGIVVVTGTNGKTTTTHMLVRLLQQSGLRVLTNASGSNLTRGLVSTVVEHSSWSGKLPYDIAVFEIDEAYAPLFAARVKPNFLVALNVMRDQLDRYGELDTTASLIAKAAGYAEALVVNANDPLLMAKTATHQKRYTFGLAPALSSQLSSEANLYGESMSEARKESNLDAEILDISTTDTTLNLTARVQDKEVTTKMSLLGVHNALNGSVALLTTKLLLPDQGLSDLAIQLSQFKPAFGRGETLAIGDRELTVALIKNPSGFTQNVNTFVGSHIDAVLVVINDEYADGRDVSWLWDAQLQRLSESKRKIFVGGTRRFDMALRLKYEGISFEVIDTKSTETLMKSVLESNEWNQHLLIIPTYTAMLAIRKWLKAQQGGKHIW